MSDLCGKNRGLLFIKLIGNVNKVNRLCKECWSQFPEAANKQRETKPLFSSSYSISIITASTARLAPSSASIDFTTADFSARRIFSIFIASTTANG